MEESTPIFDALWAKYNETPIFDQVLREHEHKKYLELVEPYKYPLNDQRVFSPEEFVEMMTSNEILSVDQIRVLFGFPEEEIKEKRLMTSKWQDLVNDFRHAMDLPVPDAPRQLTGEEAEMHIQMIRDEFEKEFVPAAKGSDLIEFYDAGIDVIVYIIGAMSNAGMDIDPGFVEIMRSNMSKMDPVTKKAIRSRGVELDGEPKGKILKGPNYEPPKLGVILNEQTTYGHEDTAVYKNITIPLTLGIGGPKIGEGVLHMDHNGDVVMKGTMMDVQILPVLDHLGLQISGFSFGDDEPQDMDLVRKNANIEPFEYLEEPVVEWSSVTEFDPPLVFDEVKASQEIANDAVAIERDEEIRERGEIFVEKILNDKEQYLKPARRYPEGMAPE